MIILHTSPKWLYQKSFSSNTRLLYNSGSNIWCQTSVFCCLFQISPGLPTIALIGSDDYGNWTEMQHPILWLRKSWHGLHGHALITSWPIIPASTLSVHGLHGHALITKKISKLRVSITAQIARVMGPTWDPTGPRLNIKTVLSMYGDFHVKDKTAVRTSYL